MAGPRGGDRAEVASPRVRESARIAAWVLALEGAVSALGALLLQHRAASLAVQAFVVEWGAGRQGVAWSDPAAPPPDARQLTRRILRGLGLGLVAAASVLSFARLTGAVSFSRWGATPGALLVGGAAVLFAAVRDELLLRGLVLRAFRHTFDDAGPATRRRVAVRALVPAFVAAGVAAAARLAQVPGDQLRAFVTSAAGGNSLVVAGLVGLSLALLWMADRGAWLPSGANVAWSFVTTTAISGGICDARWSGGTGAGIGWGGGALEASPATAIAALALAGVAISSWYRRDARTRLASGR